ncbi:MAG TPA: HepT-like ribonuclease domain-containing protein [Devosia sp.]|nr:HepT-like ribonuclease domain-containing protein [Devosia sp.]
MAPERDLSRLEDIRGAIVYAQQFVSGVTFEMFEADMMRVLAVIRCLEVISEASRRLDPAVKARHPELPWSQIAGAGNVYRHDYRMVRNDIVWETVHSALPPLLAAVEAELARRP